MNLSYSGSFSIDYQVRISFSGPLAQSGDPGQTNPIWVFASDPGLATIVAGQPAEVGGQATVAVRLITRPAGNDAAESRRDSEPPRCRDLRLLGRNRGAARSSWRYDRGTRWGTGAVSPCMRCSSAAGRGRF